VIVGRRSSHASRHRTAQLSLVAALLVAASAQPPPSDGEGDLRKLEEAVFAAVNEHRGSTGMTELSHSPEIAGVARSHSEAMARGRAGFGHSGFQQRTKAISSLMSLSAAAENVSRHTRRYSQVARASLQGWLQSSRHRRNIEGDYELSGVGAARDAEGTYYLTQIFVAR
jgi:uncharacterized protein YkwD